MAPDLHRRAPAVDVVICTYDNATLLDRCLTALGAQEPAGGPWGVLVVVNNSGDDTREVVARHQAAGRVPSLRSVDEPVQGLTPARLRGVASTTAPWIAFVDDDCLLDERWMAEALAFAAAHPGAAGFGGRVVPTFGDGAHARALPAGYGWAFAEQDLGDDHVTVDCLVGAGMVVSRVALQETGWLDGPLFADRIGRRLVSGGDVEIALRLAATGRPLWYTPACRLAHVIPPGRTATPYLARLTRSLGVSWSMASALTWPGSRRSWARRSLRGLLVDAVALLRRAPRRVGQAEGRRDLLLAASYEQGRWTGAAGVALLLVRGRCAFFGRARPGTVVRTGGDDVVRAG